jgi:NAD dependent epimerase/dehydratase family enzyme
VHRDDLTRLVCEALREPAKYEGVVNGVAPTPVTMAGLCESVAEATGRPNWLPVPGFALRAALGEGAAVVLDGQKVLPKRAEALGFEFQYEEIDEAMEAIV